jgi:pimeloyl-ACP methyl ester carboxylesterase
MKTLVKTAFITIVVLIIVYTLGPRLKSPVFSQDIGEVSNISNIESYVSNIEQRHQLKPGNEAEIVWIDSAKQQTEYAVVYLHGFSASKQEGNPVHLNFAKSINANLYLARLADHGIDTIAPMQYFTADRLWESAKQAFAIGKVLGKKVILIGTSTGGSLALQLAANYPEIHGLILLSPNIEIVGTGVSLLNDPWGLQIGRLVTGGNERIVKGKSDEYKKYWYTNYRVESIVQLEEFVEKTMVSSTFQNVKQPTLVLYYYKNEKEQDNVVKVKPILKMFAQLGTPNQSKEKYAIPNAGHHVIGSYITSKDLTTVHKSISDFYGKHLSNTK